MDTSRCSGRVTIACRAIHFTGNVPSPLTASPAETSSRERRSWRGRGVAAVLAGVVIAWAWSEGSTRVRLWVPADSRGPGGSISARVPGNRAEQALSLTARGGTSVRCPWTWAYPAPRIHVSRKFVEPVAPRIRAPGVPLAQRCP
jgi:hypothetical protein